MLRNLVPQRSVRFAVALVSAAAMLAAGCSSGDDESTVTIYSGRTDNLIQPILDDFTAETGIEVEVRYGESADLAVLINEEGDQTPADVFLSQSPGAVEFLDGEGRLAELPEGVLSLVSESVRDADGHWVGFSGRQRVLVFNPDLVEGPELPASVFDLTDPVWSGRIGIAPANGSFQDFVTGMRGQIGDAETLAWLEGLVANDVQTYPNNSGIVAAVGRGEVDAGLVNHYYNFRAINEDANHRGENHQFGDADLGGLLIVTGAAIISESDNADNAAALIEWLLGEPAQRYFADETFEYPLASGVSPSGDIPPAQFASVADLDVNGLGSDLAGTRDLITQAGLEG